MHRNKDGTITLKLADFGLAMEVKELIYTVCGTPTYVAPEILTEIGKLAFPFLELFIFWVSCPFNDLLEFSLMILFLDSDFLF